MNATRHIAWSALLGMTLSACGPALEGEEFETDTQGQGLEAGCTALSPSIASHSCLHVNNSADHVAVTATSGLTSATPSFSQTHKQYDVTLPAGATGTVKFTPGTTGSWAFYLNKTLPFTVKNGSTPLSSALAQTTSTSCGLTNYTVYNLTSGTTYTLELGTVTGNLVGVVPERVEDYNTRYYQDLDGDRYGNSSVSILSACVPPSGYVTARYDCNDSNTSINPGATEIPGNSVDENCNGSLTN
ncbi:MAG: putative metal-binding motif-containing protein [Cystobacter sp.]